MPHAQKAATVTGAQLRHLLRVTEATSRAPERDRLVLLMGLTCAMRVTEIARVLVEDVLLPSGAIRMEVSLRASITKGCRQRCIYLAHADTREALENYIEWRWAKGYGTELERRRYRGLSPQTSLIVTRRGAAFALNRKPRTLVDGEVEDYWACDALQAHVSGLYRAAGLAECSSHTGRRRSPIDSSQKGMTLRRSSSCLGMHTLTIQTPTLTWTAGCLRRCSLPPCRHSLELAGVATL